MDGSLMALFGATRIHSYMYTSIAFLSTTCQSDLYVRKPFGTTVPQDENLLPMPRRASNHGHTTSWGVHIDYCTTV